jgi:hypothetical protein
LIQTGRLIYIDMTKKRLGRVLAQDRRRFMWSRHSYYRAEIDQLRLMGVVVLIRYYLNAIHP